MKNHPQFTHEHPLSKCCFTQGCRWHPHPLPFSPECVFLAPGGSEPRAAAGAELAVGEETAATAQRRSRLSAVRLWRLLFAAGSENRSPWKQQQQLPGGKGCSSSALPVTTGKKLNSGASPALPGGIYTACRVHSGHFCIPQPPVTFPPGPSGSVQRQPRGQAATDAPNTTAQRHRAGSSDGKRCCGVWQPPAKHARTHSPAAQASGKLLVQLGNTGVFCTPRVLLSPPAPTNTRGLQGCPVFLRGHFNVVFVTGKRAHTFLCPTLPHVRTLAARVAVPEPPRQLTPCWEGAAEYGPSMHSKGISSGTAGQRGTRCPSSGGWVQHGGRRCPPEAALGSDLSCPGLDVLQISPRPLQTLPTGFCRTCTGLFLLIIPARGSGQWILPARPAAGGALLVEQSGTWGATSTSRGRGQPMRPQTGPGSAW